MAYDVLAQFYKAKGAYEKERGFTSPTKGIISPSKGVPKTTWGDVIVFYNSFLKYTDDPAVCVGFICTEGSTDFVRTKSFKDAQRRWASVSPYVKAGGVVQALMKITSNELYPWNEEFWGYGSRYALARSAAGVVPSKFSIAIEATLHHAANPSLRWAADAVEDLIPKIPEILNPSSWADLIKWSSIGGGVFLLYWYVLRKK